MFLSNQKKAFCLSMIYERNSIIQDASNNQGNYTASNTEQNS